MGGFLYLYGRRRLYLEGTLNRDLIIRFRVSQAERQALDAMLEQEDRKPAEFLRELLRSEAGRRGLWPLPAKTRSFAEAEKSMA